MRSRAAGAFDSTFANKINPAIIIIIIIIIIVTITFIIIIVIIRGSSHYATCMPALKLLLKPSYKKLTNNKVLKRQVLMRVHFVLSGRLGANNHNLSSTTAQLCWQKRDTS